MIIHDLSVNQPTKEISIIFTPQVNDMTDRHLILKNLVTYLSVYLELPVPDVDLIPKFIQDVLGQTSNSVSPKEVVLFLGYKGNGICVGHSNNSVRDFSIVKN